MIEGLRALLASPHLVDGVLAILVIEVAVLVVVGRRRRALSSADIAAQVAAGALLLLALRAALAHADPLWIGLCLMLAFPANLWDMARRWGRSR